MVQTGRDPSVPLSLAGAMGPGDGFSLSLLKKQNTKATNKSLIKHSLSGGKSDNIIKKLQNIYFRFG